MPLIAAKPFVTYLALSLACLASACQRTPKAGQSGSENIPGDGWGGGGGSTVPCPCFQDDALRVTLLSQDHGNLSLRVEEVLHGELPLVPGDVIEADRGDDTFACFRGCAPIAEDQQALAFFRPTQPALPQCDARDACVRACERDNTRNDDEAWSSTCQCRSAPLSDVMTVTGCGATYRNDARDCAEECGESTLAECPPRPEQDYKRGHVRLSPWKDPIVFARTQNGELSLPSAELDKLWQEGCWQNVGDWSQLLDNPP